MDLILLILGGFGLTRIIVDGDVFEAIRFWLSSSKFQWLYLLLSCGQCAGFWIGLILSFAVDINWLIASGVVSGINYLFDLISDEIL